MRNVRRKHHEAEKKQARKKVWVEKKNTEFCSIHMARWSSALKDTQAECAEVRVGVKSKKTSVINETATHS